MGVPSQNLRRLGRTLPSASICHGKSRFFEKERLVAEVKSANELTEEEVAAIDLNYSTPDESNPFESLLSKLYEVNADDDDAEAEFF